MAHAAAPSAARALSAPGADGRRLCGDAVRAVQPPTKTAALRLLGHIWGHHSPRVDKQDEGVVGLFRVRVGRERERISIY